MICSLSTEHGPAITTSFFAADNNARCNLNDSIVRMELAVCQLERLLHLDDVLDLRVEA